MADIRPRVPPDVRARGTGAGVSSGGAPGQAPPQQLPSFIPYLDPDFYRPDNAVDFLQFLGTSALAAAAGSTIDDASLQMRINAGFRGVIKFVTIFVDAPTTLIDVTWSLKINGNGVPGFDSLKTFPRSANNLSLTFDGTIRVQSQDRISLTITNNNANGPWNVGASYGGWQYPDDTARRMRLGLV